MLNGSLRNLIFLAWLLAFLPPARSADDSQPAAKGATAADRLVLEEASIADSYARFKNALLKLAELTRATDPARAELLEKAAQQISASGTDDQFRAILKLLDSELLRDVDQAIDKQGQVDSDLNALLKLLLSENRDRRNASEKERLRGYIKDIDEAIKIQQGIQGQTERGGDPQELPQRQARLAERTEGIAKKIEANEELPADKNPAKEGPGSNAGGKKLGQHDPAKKTGPEKPSDQAKKPGTKPSPGGRQAPGDKQTPGKPGQGNDSPSPPSGEAPPPDDQANGRRQVQEAAQRMREAQRRLEEANRRGATKEQEQAIANLEKAKAELQEVLRQLREEEVEKTLVMLEARFRNMLKLQQAVYDATVLLDKKPAPQRDRADEIESSRLSRREQEIIAELDKAMNLLREDGSAVAFPAAVEQLREDMDSIAERLGRTKIGSSTQQIEQDVIDSLKEMIAALEKAQKDLQLRKSMPPQGQPADPPLVDSISELKMLRALQMRVNRRTRQYDEMIRSGESTAADILPRLRTLAEHQQKIYQIARDLHLGRNE